MKILSRKDASTQGSNFYFTGVLCKNGHLSQRYTATCSCKECIKGYQNKMRRSLALSMSGNPIYSRPVHALDHAAVDAYVDALYLQRGMVPPPSPTMPPAPRPQPTRWQLWTRLYSPNIALELLRTSPPHSPEELQVLANNGVDSLPK